MEQHPNVRHAAIRQYGQRKNENTIPQENEPGKLPDYPTIVAYSNVVPIEKAAKEASGEENY